MDALFDDSAAPSFGSQVADLTRGRRRALVKSGALVAVHRGVVMAADQASDPLVRIRAAAKHLGREAIAVLGSALQLHGIDGLVGARNPEFSLPEGRERLQRDGIDLHFWRIGNRDIAMVDGIRVTSVARTLADACRCLPRMQAVACVDSALHQGLVLDNEYTLIAAMMARRPGVVNGRRWLRQARHGCESPLETRVRLQATDYGFPPDELQVAFTDEAGVVTARADMGYRLPGGGWLLLEADGIAPHSLVPSLLHDRRRQNELVSRHRAEVLRFTWADTQIAGYVASVIRPILTEAGWRPRSELLYRDADPTHPRWP